MENVFSKILEVQLILIVPVTTSKCLFSREGSHETTYS